MKRLQIFFLFCTCLLFFGCSGCTNPDAEQARAIIRMSPQQRREAFAGLPPSKQLDVYLYAATKVEPGLIFSDDVAANWRSVLPVLKERLASESNEKSRLQLIWLLAAISDNYCSLAERKDVLGVASQATAAMGELRKTSADEALRKIANPPKQLSECGTE